MRTGKVSLKMWPNRTASPELTVVANNTDPEATILHLDFGDHPDIVVFPTEALSYGSLHLMNSLRLTLRSLYEDPPAV